MDDGQVESMVIDGDQDVGGVGQVRGFAVVCDHPDDMIARLSIRWSRFMDQRQEHLDTGITSGCTGIHQAP
jgi:hypothetical protein